MSAITPPHRTRVTVLVVTAITEVFQTAVRAAGNGADKNIPHLSSALIDSPPDSARTSGRVALIPEAGLACAGFGTAPSRQASQFTFCPDSDGHSQQDQYSDVAESKRKSDEPEQY